MRVGDIVVIRELDDLPEHLFEVHEIHEDHITGIALSGPLAGAYGEPDIELVLRVHAPALGSS